MGSANNAIVSLWVPVAVFAHIFAAAWLLKVFLLGRTNPLKRKLKKTKTAGKSPTTGTKGPSSEGPVQAAPGDAGLRSDVEAAIPDQDQHQGQDQEPSPFEAANFSGAMSDDYLSVNDGDDDGNDDGGSSEDAGVPDASPLACATLRKRLSVAPETFDMEWQEMGCSIVEHGKAKVVLEDVWGRARPGQMQALMGPSGAGKSTFMDILAMRKSVGLLTGRLLLAGKPATKSFIRQTAYVPQEDNFVPTMTTKETLTFYAKVILSAKRFKSAQAREARVVEVLQSVGLGHRHNVLVGGALPGGLLLRGLSGGERKRLSIAAGILAVPAVIFLDEPTSGLDSFAALQVMGRLLQMSRVSDQIVISTIHQPRVAIWQMFDKVTLLAGGRLMYHGGREGLTSWFSSIGYTHDPSRDGVVSDWCLDLVAVGFNKPEQFYGHTMRTREHLLEASKEFLDHYIKNVQPSSSATPGVALVSSGSMQEISHKASNYATGPVRQFMSLLQREFVLITRNPFDVAARCLTFTWVAILIGLLYYSMPSDGTSLRSRLNVCYVALCFLVLMPYISMGLYTSDKKFYLADASAKLYRPLAYYLAKVVVTTPFQIICALCFAWTLYGMAGLRYGGEYILKYGCITTLVYLIAVQVLHCCAIVAPNQDLAFMLSIVWTTIQLLVSTFFVVFSEVTFNNWLTQLRYINAVYFGFEALVLNEFSNVQLDCSSGLGPEYMAFVTTALPKLDGRQKAVIQAAAKPSQGCIVDTKAVLEYFQFTRPFGHSAGILAGYLIIMHGLTFGAMVLSARHEAR